MTNADRAGNNPSSIDQFSGVALQDIDLKDLRS